MNALLPFWPELKSGWCQTATVHAAVEAPRSCRSHSYCGDPALTGIMLFSMTTCQAPRVWLS